LALIKGSWSTAFLSGLEVRGERLGEHLAAGLGRRRSGGVPNAAVMGCDLVGLRDGFEVLSPLR
jgi:hypothetical protein